MAFHSIRTRIFAVPAALCLAGALLAACGDGDEGDATPETRRDAGGTVTGSAQTQQTGPNSDPSAPGGTLRAGGSVTSGGSGTATTGTTGSTPMAGSSQTPISGDPETALRTRLEEDFSDEEWYDSVEDFEVDGDSLVAKLNEQTAAVDEEAVDQICTVLAGTVFGAQNTFDLETVRVETAAGEVLATASGPQCDP